MDRARCQLRLFLVSGNKIMLPAYKRVPLFFVYGCRRVYSTLKWKCKNIEAIRTFQFYLTRSYAEPWGTLPAELSEVGSNCRFCRSVKN